MNIGISFSGEGFGHASRIGALARELKKQHELTFWCPNIVCKFFKKVVNDARVNHIPHMQLVKKNNEINRIATVVANIKNLFFCGKKIKELSEQLSEHKIEAVISDYDQFLPKAAKMAGIPVLLFNHQGVLSRISSHNIDALTARLVNRFMMPSANEIIVSSFYNGDVGPLLRQEIKNAKVKKQDFVIVYVKNSCKKKLVPLLKKFRHVSFRFFPNKKSDFIAALASCKAVISPAGHQLISECLALKKPMLLLPEKRQYEQILNAKMVSKAGWGKISSLESIETDLPAFLEIVNQFPLPVEKNGTKFILQDDTRNAVRKINKFLKHIKRNKFHSIPSINQCNIQF